MEWKAQKISEEELVRRYQEVREKEGPHFGYKVFQRVSGTGGGTVEAYFGTWNAFKARMGDPLNEGPLPSNKLSREDIEERYREMREELGSGITLEEFKEETGTSHSTIKREFGSWLKLKEAMGDLPNKPGSKPQPHKVGSKYHKEWMKEKGLL